AYNTRKERTTDELLEYRMKQIKEMGEDLRNAQLEKDEIRQKWKEIHDRKAKVKETYLVGDLVLVYDSTHGQVYVNELDDNELRDSITRNRVKKLFTWNEGSLEQNSEQVSEDEVGLEDEDPWGSSSYRIVFGEPLYLDRNGRAKDVTNITRDDGIDRNYDRRGDVGWHYEDRVCGEP
ncbi:9471_t:CDS:2, partial [Ambispora leptoticha]